MNFIPSVYERRDWYFLNFANKFFGKNFWNKVLDEDKVSCIFLCAFYTIVQTRCNLSKEETLRIIYNSLKEKFFTNETFEDFCIIFKKYNNKFGLKGLIPFFNSDIKKTFDNFEFLYLKYEEKMHERGDI